MTTVVVKWMRGGGHHVYQGVVSTAVVAVAARLVQRACVDIIQVLAWYT